MPDTLPDPDDEFRRKAADLLRRQLAGLAPPPGRISRETLAAELGISRRKIADTERKFRHLLLRHLPEIRDRLNSTKPQP